MGEGRGEEGLVVRLRGKSPSGQPHMAGSVFGCAGEPLCAVGNRSGGGRGRPCSAGGTVPGGGTAGGRRPRGASRPPGCLPFGLAAALLRLLLQVPLYRCALQRWQQPGGWLDKPGDARGPGHALVRDGASPFPAGHTGGRGRV